MLSDDEQDTIKNPLKIELSKAERVEIARIKWEMIAAADRQLIERLRDYGVSQERIKNELEQRALEREQALRNRMIGTPPW